MNSGVPEKLLIHEWLISATMFEFSHLAAPKAVSGDPEHSKPNVFGRLLCERHGFAPTSASLGSYSTMYPATALAATVNGEARYICPGPLRPGKLRFCALITT